MSIERSGGQWNGQRELPPEVAAELQKKRQEIDRIDETLIELLAMRFQITSGVGEIKRTHRLPALDAGREEALHADRCESAEAAGLDAAFCRQLFNDILSESRRCQQEQLDG